MTQHNAPDHTPPKKVLNNPDHSQQEASPPAAEGMQKRELTAWILLAVLVTVIVTSFVTYRYLFPVAFTPVTLQPVEKNKLQSKLQQLGVASANKPSNSAAEAPPLVASPYSEVGAQRRVVFTERELNALLASNTNQAESIAVDLAENLFSVVILLPMDPQFPLVGGKNLRLNAGAELAFAQGRPIVKLRGVSVMGVPLPNAWLGQLKNVDLVNEFGAEPGFWQAFAAGVDSLKVREGQFEVRLKE